MIEIVALQKKEVDFIQGTHSTNIDQDTATIDINPKSHNKALMRKLASEKPPLYIENTDVTKWVNRRLELPIKGHIFTKPIPFAMPYSFSIYLEVSNESLDLIREALINYLSIKEETSFIKLPTTEIILESHYSGKKSPLYGKKENVELLIKSIDYKTSKEIVGNEIILTKTWSVTFDTSELDGKKNKVKVDLGYEKKSISLPSWDEI